MTNTHQWDLAVDLIDSINRNFKIRIGVVVNESRLLRVHLDDKKKRDFDLVIEIYGKKAQHLITNLEGLNGRRPKQQAPAFFEKTEIEILNQGLERDLQQTSTPLALRRSLERIESMFKSKEDQLPLK
jgi:hypothetical protein